MRAIGMLHPTDAIPAFPDNVGIAVISSAGAVVAFDWPTGANIVGFDGHAPFYLHPRTTGVAVPTTSQAGSTSQNLSMRMNQAHDAMYQIPGDSTGYSVTAETTGVIGMCFWRK